MHLAQMCIMELYQPNPKTKFTNINAINNSKKKLKVTNKCLKPYGTNTIQDEENVLKRQ